MADELLPECTAVDSVETMELKPAVRHHWQVLAGLAVIQTLVVVLLFGPRSNGNENFPYAMIGVMFSQPLLFSLWAAFAPQRFYVRFLWCLPLCCLISFCEVLKFTFATPRDNSNIFIMIVGLTIFLVMTAIMLFVRHFFGWQLAHLSIVNGESDYQSYQFGIKHLIILTTVSGFVLGLFRSLFVLSSSASLRSVGEVIKISTEIMLMVIPILFLFWFSLINLKKVGYSVVFAVIFLVVLEIANFVFVPMLERANEMYRVIPFFQLGCGASVLFSALVIRWCGFRLVRVKS